MITALRRILITALIAALAGLGVVVALLGRRPRTRVKQRTAVPVPVAAPVPAPRTTGGRRGLAIGLVCPLILTGLARLVYERHDATFGVVSRAPDGAGQPLAALPPSDTGTARTPSQADERTTQSARTREEPGPPANRPPSRPSASAAPGFDVVRVEPNGDAVIAGRAAPNASVEVLVDGQPVARAQADAGGHFTLTPPPLPAGSSEIGLRATDAKGDTQRSSTRVAVVVAPARDARPLVALSSPDAPTQVLSRPDGPAPGNPAPTTVPGRDAPNAGRDEPGADAGIPTTGIGTGARRAGGATSPTDPTPRGARPAEKPVADATTASPKVVSIDAQDGGKLFVTGRAAPGASLRLYLSDSPVAPATVGRDGTVTFTIGQGVKPGKYRVRLDLVDPVTGKVRDRAEVPFTAPGAGHDEGVEYAATQQGGAPQTAVPGPSGRRTPEDAAAPRAHPADPARPAGTGSLAADVPSGAMAGSAAVYVPRIETARIVRGDNLWTISRRTYGEGERYTLIFDANQDQVRDPDLIYPGQVLVLPDKDVVDAGQTGKRD